MIRLAALAAAALVALWPAGATAHSLVPMQTVGAARIAATAAAAVRAAVPDPSRALAPALAIGDQVVPAGEVSIQAGSVAVNATFASVPVIVRVDGFTVRTVYAGYRITTYVRTAVAARDLTAGTIVSDGDVTTGAVAAGGRAPVTPALVVGRRLTIAVAKGAALQPEMTIVVQVVHAGAPALLIVHDGPVLLAADVVARSSGGIGESVTVYNPQTQRALSGVVTGPDTVELTLPGGQ